MTCVHFSTGPRSTISAWVQRFPKLCHLRSAARLTVVAQHLRWRLSVQSTPRSPRRMAREIIASERKTHQQPRSRVHASHRNRRKMYPQRSPLQVLQPDITLAVYPVSARFQAMLQPRLRKALRARWALSIEEAHITPRILDSRVMIKTWKWETMTMTGTDRITRA